MRRKTAESGSLDRHRHEGGDAGGRAFIGIGRPHVEGYGRDLEAETGQHQEESQDQQRVVLPFGCFLGDDVQVGAAADPVEARDIP